MNPLLWCVRKKYQILVLIKAQEQTACRPNEVGSGLMTCNAWLYLSFLAIRTDPVDLQQMSLDLKVELGRELLGEVVGHAFLEFDDGVAMVADEVMMAAPGHDDEMGSAGALVNGADDTEGAEQIQGAIDGHAADLGRLTPHRHRQSVCRDVAFAVGQGRDNCFAGRGQTITVFDNSLVEELNGVRHGTS